MAYLSHWGIQQQHCANKAGKYRNIKNFILFTAQNSHFQAAQRTGSHPTIWRYFPFRNWYQWWSIPPWHSQSTHWEVTYMLDTHLHALNLVEKLESLQFLAYWFYYQWNKYEQEKILSWSWGEVHPVTVTELGQTCDKLKQRAGGEMSPSTQPHHCSLLSLAFGILWPLLRWPMWGRHLPTQPKVSRSALIMWGQTGDWVLAFHPPEALDFENWGFSC